MLFKLINYLFTEIFIYYFQILKLCRAEPQTGKEKQISTNLLSIRWPHYANSMGKIKTMYDDEN